MKLFEWLDKIGFLELRVWDFSFRSMIREYGRNFTTRVLLRHPIKTWRGINAYRKAKGLSQNQESLSTWKAGPDALIGVGFCLKPLNPACPSGRANHDCFFFETHLYENKPGQFIPPCCQDCKIREIGLAALSAGSPFYIMTSAQDILFDLFLPALNTRRFTRALVAICKYSYEPFAMASAIVGTDTYLFPYESGDCKDYKTWRLADIGIKEEQTDIDASDYKTIKTLLQKNENTETKMVSKQGHIFYPS